MKKKLLIIGAGGHGRVCADIAEAMGDYSDIVFADDGTPEILPQYPLIGNVEYGIQNSKDREVFVAIGNGKIRERISGQVLAGGKILGTLIHPTAVISRNAIIGAGSVIMPGAVVNNNVRIGNGVILNTSSSVDHDCKISDYCHVSVGAHLAGNVSIGKHTWIGVGAAVIQNICIGNDCMIGAGAVIVSSIAEPGTYVGVPAKRL